MTGTKAEAPATSAAQATRSLDPGGAMVLAWRVRCDAVSCGHANERALALRDVEHIAYGDLRVLLSS